MRILSWNVEKLKAERQAIASKITSHRADLVALQEFQPGDRGRELINLLDQAGYSVTIAGSTGKGICNALFSKVPISPATPPGSLPGEQWSGFWLESVAGPLSLSFVHIPVLGYRRERQLYCDAILKRCTDSHSVLHAIVGDLNTTPPGVNEPGKRLPGGKWLRDLAGLGWLEAWRHVNTTAEEYSWYSRFRNGFRIDQAWLSPSLAQHLVGAALDHSARDEDLSDHSILLVDFEGLAAE